MFQNLSVDLDTLPRYTQADFHRLQPRYRLVRLFGGLIFAFFMLGGLAIGSLVAPPHWWKTLAWAVAPVVILLPVVYQWIAFPYMRYALREHDIIFEAGWLWKGSTVVPFTRIQHAEVEQSFFERMYGLATLNIYTAGGSSSDLAIPGLTRDRAHQLRDYILKTSRLTEVAPPPPESPGTEAEPQPDITADDTPSQEAS